MAKKTENYLDYVPAISPLNDWDVDEDDGLVTVHMVHRGFYAYIAQKFFRRPRVSHIHLDTNGSFIFRHINGKRTVNDIAELVKAEFGQDAEPLYDRLVKYMQILYEHKFIYYVGKGKMPK